MALVAMVMAVALVAVSELDTELLRFDTRRSFRLARVCRRTLFRQRTALTLTSMKFELA